MMKLRYSPTSPFARKVRITIHELGLGDRVELLVTDPWTDAALRADNPLGKVPLLILDDGEALYDSPVICEYLDSRAGGKLFPPAGAARWRALKLQALGDGMAEATARRFVEGRRPVAEQSQAVINRQAEAIQAALGAAERVVAALAVDSPTIGEIAIAAALGYLEFRAPEEDFRTAQPKLSGWLARFGARASYAATRPPAG